MHQPPESVKEFEKQLKTVVITALEGVIQPPQETSVEISQAKEDLMKSIQTFLKKYTRISFSETPKVLTLAWEKFFEIQHAQPEDIQELLHKLLKDLQIIKEELAEYINSPSWNRLAFYEDDDDDEYTIQYREYLENSSNAIIIDLPTEEPDNSLSMGDEHLSTILKTELDDVIKSSVENLVQSQDIPKENFKINSNPLFDEEIISSKIDPHHFNAESDLIEFLLNQYILTVSYPKIDSLLEEFSGELAHINLVPPGINKADFDPEEEIRLIEELLYDNSSPRPPEESNSEISDATIESSSISPIPIEDIDSLMEEIDLFLNPDDSIPPGIESDDYDSEGDILFLKELLSNDSLPKTESFHFDHYDVPSSPHIDTLLPFSSENEDKVFNPGILSSNILSHRGKITSDFSEIPMMISRGDIPHLDVPFLHFYPP
ncbi:hypothetical protein Tco_1482434 [Tanacetum coccineum]